MTESLNDLPYLLRMARPTLAEITADPKGCEEERIKAVQCLLALARATLDPDAGQYPPKEVTQYLQEVGLRLLLADNPVKELREWLGLARGRGRPAKDERLHITIAARVWKLRRKGMTVEDACTAVAKESGAIANVDATRVRDIFYKYNNEGFLASATVEDYDRSSE